MKIHHLQFEDNEDIYVDLPGTGNEGKYPTVT